MEIKSWQIFDKYLCCLCTCISVQSFIYIQCQFALFVCF